MIESRRIPAFDCRQSFHEHRDEFLAAITRVLESGILMLGPEVREFEDQFSQFVGADYAIGTSSGTDALIIALRALGVEHGDEVVTVANGPAPTASAIRAVGAIPRFVDVDDSTLQMCPAKLCSIINPRTRCVIPIHLYGYPAPVDRIQQVCDEHGIHMIEDCAQAHGTCLAGRHVGMFGKIGCFSFYPTKNLGAFGDAGICVTPDAQIAQRLRELSCYGFRGDRVSHTSGFNCRLDELQAACLNVKLKYLPESLTRRSSIAQNYRRLLAGTGILSPTIAALGQSAWHQYVVRVKNRADWIDYHQQHDIYLNIHYAHPVHLMPAFEMFGEGLGSLPVTERACSEVLSLPMFPELDDDQVVRVAQVFQTGSRSGLC